MMASTPAWMHQFDNHKPRSQSLQPGSPAHLDAKSPYQPLKWHPEYKHGGLSSNLSPGQDASGQSSRSPASPNGGRSSLFPRTSPGATKLNTIPEDHFLDRGTDFHFVGGVRNPAFEMDSLNVDQRHYHRRASDSVLVDKGFQQNFPPQRDPRIGSPDFNGYRNNANDGRSGRRKSDVNIHVGARHDARSDVSVGGRSTKSITSTRSDASSEKSDDTKLTTLSSRSDRRPSEPKVRTANDRRVSVTSYRRGCDKQRSTSLSSNNSKSGSCMMLANIKPIEIPIEFIETPASRIKKLFGPIIMCILVITLAASLGAAIYFATVLKEAQEETIGLLKAQLEMATSGVNIQTLTLHQKQSLTMEYCKQMDLFYSESSLFQNGYRKCKVNSLTSTRITFTLYFDEDEDEATTENIVSVLRSRAKTERQVQVNQLKLDLDSIKVTLMNNVNDRAKKKAKKKDPTKGMADVAKTVSPTKTKRLNQKSIATSSTFSPSSTTTSTTTVMYRKTTRKPRATTSPDSKPNPCEGKSGDYFPHHRECNLYIHCHNGLSVTMACAADTVFDISKKVCVQRSGNVVCPFTTPSKGYDRSKHDPWDPCRTADTTQLYQYPDECNLFFQCQYNKSIVRLCPDDTVFDKDAKICLPPGPDVKCYVITTTGPNPAAADVTGSPNAKKGPTTTLAPIVYPSRPYYDPHPCQQESGLGIYPHPDHCNKYIQCEHGNDRVMSCATNLYFNPKVNACVRPKNDLICPDITPCAGMDDRAFFPHPKICSKFITCSQENEILQECPAGLVWDPRENSCVPKTDSSVCPESNT